MKRIAYYLQLILIYTLLWVIFMENSHIFTIVTGLLIASLSITLIERYILHGTFYELYPFNLYRMLNFSFFLLKEIYKSGLSMIPLLIKGQASPTFMEITTDLEDNLSLVMLSNAITLTPGTITVDIEGQRLLVLWMNPTTNHPTEAAEIIKGAIERKITEGI